jgi:hypothetical protein
MADSVRDTILKILDFGSYCTTPLYFEVKGRIGSVGVKSLVNRCQELQADGKIIGEVVEGHKEKRWRIVRYDKQQGMLL